MNFHSIPSSFGSSILNCLVLLRGWASSWRIRRVIGSHRLHDPLVPMQDDWSTLDLYPPECSSVCTHELRKRSWLPCKRLLLSSFVYYQESVLSYRPALVVSLHLRVHMLSSFRRLFVEGFVFPYAHPYPGILLSISNGNVFCLLPLHPFLGEPLPYTSPLCCNDPFRL